MTLPTHVLWIYDGGVALGTSVLYSLRFVFPTPQISLGSALLSHIYVAHYVVRTFHGVQHFFRTVSLVRHFVCTCHGVQHLSGVQHFFRTFPPAQYFFRTFPGVHNLIISRMGMTKSY